MRIFNSSGVTAELENPCTAEEACRSVEDREEVTPPPKNRRNPNKPAVSSFPESTAIATVESKATIEAIKIVGFVLDLDEVCVFGWCWLNVVLGLGWGDIYTAYIQRLGNYVLILSSRI